MREFGHRPCDDQVQDLIAAEKSQPSQTHTEYDPFGVRQSWPDWAGRYRPFTPHQVAVLEALAGRK